MELKSCPFCGSEAKMQPVKINGKAKKVVQCTGKNCKIHSGPLNFGKDAIIHWNTRK